MKHERLLYGIDFLHVIHVDWSLGDLKFSNSVVDVNK